MKIGSLVTWKVDCLEFSKMASQKNESLEIGLVLEEFQSENSEIVFAKVLWYSKSMHVANVPIDNIIEVR